MFTIIEKTSRNLPGWRRAKVVVGTKVCQVRILCKNHCRWLDTWPDRVKTPQIYILFTFQCILHFKKNIFWRTKLSLELFQSLKVWDKQKYLKRLSKTSQVFNFSWTHSFTIINVEISKNELTSCHGNQLVPYGRLMARAAWRIEIVAMKPAWMMMMA